MTAEALSGWANFYTIVGSSAGALIGLQFVAMSLISDLPAVQGSADAGHAFATPTIVHFGAAFLLAAVMSAPWHGINSVAIVWGLLGVAGLIYAAIVVRRMRRQTAYRPEFEDWLFHGVLPIAAYGCLTGSAWLSGSQPQEALFAVAASALLLLFIGIHNAWDAVTYHIFVMKRRLREKKRTDE